MENNKYPKFITDFTNYLIAIKNYSLEYVKNITTTLQQFLSFINVHKYNNKYENIAEMTLNDIRYLSNSDIYSFIFFLAENHYKIGSRILKVDHLRSFFNFLYKIPNKIFTQPFKKIKREKNIYLKLPNYLSLNESKKLLLLYENSDKINEIRDSAIMHIFLNCGLRISEVANLNISDFNLKTNAFKVFGKGNKERTAYLNKSTREALLKYLDLRKTITTKSPKDNNALFLSSERRRISTRNIRKNLKKAYIKAGIDAEEYSAHTLRHTCATLLYINGTDINTLKEVLGHVRIDTTEIYTHLHDKDVMQAMQDHPLSKFRIQDAIAYEAAMAV